MLIKSFFTSTKAWVTRWSYVQVPVVALAFALMVIISSYFMGNIVHQHLAENAVAALNFTQSKIKSDLLEPESILAGFSEVIRGMIMRGKTVDEIQYYLGFINAYVQSNDADRLAGVIGFYGIFDAFNNKFLLGSADIDWELPEDYVPQTTAWYLAAVEAKGNIGITQPYVDTYSGEYCITFARRIFDADGIPLGIVCLDMALSRIIGYAIDTYFSKSGYGVLMNNRLEIIAHPDEDLLGKSLYDVDGGIAEFADDLEQGKPVSGRRVFNYTGEPTIVFFRQFENNWYMGVVTPENEYLADVRTMQAMLATLGAILAFIVSIILFRIIREKRKTEERTQIMLDAMPLGVNFWNNRLENIDCNWEAVRLFGLSDKQEYLDRFFEFSPEHQPNGRPSTEMANDWINSVFKEGYARFEWMHRNVGGEIIPCEITLVRVKSRSGYVVVAYIRDIREQKALFREMRRAEIAEESNREKSNFLARVSHEIRTPMNAILGITEIQLQNENSPELKEALEKIHHSGYLLLGIINDILDLSKIESGKMELTPVKYDVASLINDTIHLNVMRYESKPLEVNLQVDENIPSELFGDELRIKQILNNLLSNAFKYTDFGEVSLWVTVESPPEEESKQISVVFRVSDTGQGMTQEQVERLFDEYTRFNLEANRTTVGTGLGMSITRHLVRMMKGEISVESDPGKGSVFTVRLPQETVGAAALGKEMADNLRQFNLGKASQREKAPQIVRDYMPYGRVLVVDDVETNLYVARGLMAPYGLSVETAISGFESIDKVKSGAVYDVIFMDHFMPKMDGIEATKYIRALGYTNPIVALTANAIVGQAEMFLENGFDGFISKPIDIRQLNAMLNKLIRDKYPADIVEAAQKLKASLRKSTSKGIPEAMDPQLAKIFMRDAQKAETVLETFYEKRDNFTEEDIHQYIINVHSMKSALSIIGESDLSSLAAKLEQAGRERNMAVIADETPVFLNLLREVIEKIKPREDTQTDEITAEDRDYLHEKLISIQGACVKYDKKTAKDTVAELQKKTWPVRITEQLESIADRLLHSEFEEAAKLASVDIQNRE
jgi:signal transduction histidine kinase/CheY-like chemotaxis protein/HPt (histidine-containing phosphotransfer) domain-containing protein